MKFSLFNAKKANTDIILRGRMLEAILALAIPVVINSFLQTMYNLTDTYWLGHIGSEELASINLVSPVQNIVLNFGSGLTVAGSVLIAQYIGAGKKREAGKMAAQVYVCALIFSITAALLLCLATGSIVSFLGADGTIYDYSVQYLQLVLLDMPFLFTINIYQAVNQAQGDTMRPMLLNFLGICINLVLDPLFMVGFKWGVRGAALATLVAKIPSAVIAYRALTNKKNELYITFKDFCFERDKLLDILRIGFPTAIGSSTMQFGFLLMSKNVYVYGTSAMAAYGIGNKVNGLITLPANGIGSATATIVGQNIGAGQLKRAEKGYRLSMYICVIFLFIGGMLLSRMPVSTAAVRIFSDDPAVIEMASDFLSIMAFWCFTNGVHTTTNGLFQGTGHTEVTMLMDASRLWVFRFLTLFICGSVLHMGVRSVWYSVVVSNGITSLLLYILYLTGLWKKPKLKSLKK